MKNRLVIIGLALSLGLMSCEKNLQEEPRDFISEVNFYQNSNDAKSAITGAYSALAGTFNITYFLFLNNQTDYVNGRGSQAPLSDFTKTLDVANVGRAEEIWGNLYIIINRANTVLTKVPEIEMDENTQRQILAEAKYLRAIAYFSLVRGFGPVPLRTDPTSGIDELGGIRAPVEDVYELIIDDLKSAIPDLPGSVGEETGRASKYAGEMLLSDVYLTTENWKEAADLADDIINSKEYALIEVTESDDFYDIFATETNTEDIFSIHHTTSRQSEVPNYLHKPSTPPYNYGSGGVYAWMPNMNSWLKSWDKNDLRRDFNLYNEHLDDQGNVVPNSDPEFLFGKFITDKNGDRIYSDPIYRYTEAFLIFAEADCMDNDGPTALGLERLNIIRRRAYGYDLNSTSPVDFPSALNKEDFRDSVLMERAKSFVVEPKRYWDLIRTGTFKEALNKVGKDVIDDRLLWPIAQEELENNPDLSLDDQNPGY